MGDRYPTGGQCSALSTTMSTALELYMTLAKFHPPHAALRSSVPLGLGIGCKQVTTCDRGAMKVMLETDFNCDIDYYGATFDRSVLPDDPDPEELMITIVEVDNDEEVCADGGQYAKSSSCSV